MHSYSFCSRCNSPNDGVLILIHVVRCILPKVLLYELELDVKRNVMLLYMSNVLLSTVLLRRLTTRTGEFFFVVRKKGRIVLLDYNH